STFLLSILRPPPTSTLFPYTTLFRSSDAGHTNGRLGPPARHRSVHATRTRPHELHRQRHCSDRHRWVGEGPRHRRTQPSARSGSDRKSTRLNSSHLGISYAVFCLKKK